METPLHPRAAGKSWRRKRGSTNRASAPAEEPSRAFPTVKAVAVLETMASARRPLGVAELGALLGIPKSTVHRIVRMLGREGLLQREPGSPRYVPGVRLVRLGLDIVAAAIQRAPRYAILEALSHQIGETCNFGVMADSHVVYLGRVESKWPFGLRFEAGSRVPLHCTSMGKLFLSMLPRHSRMTLLRSISLHRYTENTITDVDRLEAELEKIRASGISVDNQEFLAGVVCVAVPVRTTSGTPVAALAVSAPLARMTVEQGLTHVPLLREAAERLARTIDDDVGKETSRQGNKQECV